MKRKRREILLEEIVDDLIYFSLSAFFAIFAVFMFDIHRSFYQESLFPLKFIFKTMDYYLIGALGGGILGLIWIKFFLFAVQKGTFYKIKKCLELRLRRRARIYTYQNCYQILDHKELKGKILTVDGISRFFV